MVTVGSLFDGIGGAPLCATMCGAIPVWSSEIEPIPISITKRHFPHMKHYGDITKINGAEVEPVDIIVGGSPCQDLSVAGKRAGLDGERSGLFMEQIRIVKEMRNATNGVQPRFMVWENVPGAFSSNNGEDYRIVLEETARVADPTVRIPRCEAWSNAGSILGDGFSISWRVIDAQYWGVPQRRRRIYLVADFGGQSAPQVLFESTRVPWHPAAGGEAGQGVAGDAQNRIRTAEFDGYNGDITGDTSATLGANCGMTTGRNGVLCLNDQGGSMMDVSHLAGTLRHQAHGHEPVICLQGNGIDRADTAGCNGKGWCEDVSYTLNTIDRPAVFDAYQHHNWRENESIGPLTTAGSHGGGDTPLVMEQAVFAQQRSDEYQESGVVSTQAARQYKDATDLVLNQTVRRLTPIECERLQGYPDNWTALTHDGKPVSDSARYKALGNSFAIPCALFVIQGCVEKLDKASQQAYDVYERR